MAALPQFAPPAMAGPDFGPAERDRSPGVVVAHVCGVEDDLEIIVDISLQPQWLREPERLRVRDVVRGPDPPASLSSCRHLTLEIFIKVTNNMMRDPSYRFCQQLLLPVELHCAGHPVEQDGDSEVEYLLVVGGVEQDSMEDDLLPG